MAMVKTLAGIVAVLLPFFCFGLDLAGAEQKIAVTVSIQPQKYFVQRVGGDLVDITVMVPAGASPHSYEPKPQQMVALAKSKIYFAMGVNFEQAWLDKLSAASPKMLVAYTAAGIQKRFMARHTHSHEESEAEHHGHSESADSEHGGTDPHIWLSPPLVMLQAHNILTGLIQVDPENREIYEVNYRNFIVELVDLDKKIRDLFWRKGKGLKFMVFHPAWGYFADAYGLQQVPVEIEGKEPKARDLRHLIELAGQTGIGVLFVQPQFSARSAQTIADEIGGRVVAADPLAVDWQNNLLHVAEAIAAAAK
ncbi:MAG: zinc ABC transporter substrate-binding protein [Desulforhabdus sp.]|jgi:zinc transport system substrate-binding protein|nr:zinc ABC transporter substrate-binding protein [Desulforhabdus sp.]